MTDDVFNQKFHSGKFDEIFSELSDINFKHLDMPLGSYKEKADDYNSLWLRLFPDGEPESIKGFRRKWEAKIEEKEKRQFSLRDSYLRQAKEISDERLIEFVSKWNDMSDEEIDIRNEFEFKHAILNRLAKNSISKFHDNPFYDVYFYIEPWSHIFYKFRREMISSELKKRKLEVA